MASEINAVTKYVAKNPRSVALGVGSGVVASWLFSGLIIPLIVAVVGFFVGRGIDESVRNRSS